MSSTSRAESNKFAAVILQDAVWRAALTAIDDSSPGLSDSNNSTAGTWKSGLVGGSNISGLLNDISIFNKPLNMCIDGGTDVYFCEELAQSPSATYLPYEYVESLVRENRGLEMRVGEIETQLAAIQQYIPTISRMIGEYERATTNVSGLLSELRRRSGSRGTLAIARERDAQNGPYPDWQE
jgi:hypothetical protein